MFTFLTFVTTLTTGVGGVGVVGVGVVGVGTSVKISVGRKVNSVGSTLVGVGVGGVGVSSHSGRNGKKSHMSKPRISPISGKRNA